MSHEGVTNVTEENVTTGPIRTREPHEPYGPTYALADAAAALRLRKNPESQALAELLEHMSDDMADEHAFEREHPERLEKYRFAVHSGDYGDERHDWTAAVVLARAINGGAR